VSLFTFNVQRKFLNKIS